MPQTCAKCQRRKVADYHVEPESAWKTVVLDRWSVGKLCVSCFDVEAEKARVPYRFIAMTAQSWNEQPSPRNPFKWKR